MTPSVLKFPTLVYKTPGSHSADGVTFDYLPVNNEEGLANAIKRGFYLSLPEAIAGQHDMEKIDSLVTADPIQTAHIPHVADPAIQTLAPNLNVTPGVAGQALDHPMDKSGGTPDDLRGLEQPSATTHDLSDDTTLTGGTAPTPVVDLDTDRPADLAGDQLYNGPAIGTTGTTSAPANLGTAAGETAGVHTDASNQQGRTRDELEARANELGIDYDGRISNKRLAALIADREQHQGE